MTKSFFQCFFLFPKRYFHFFRFFSPMKPRGKDPPKLASKSLVLIYHSGCCNSYPCKHWSAYSKALLPPSLPSKPSRNVISLFFIFQDGLGALKKYFHSSFCRDSTVSFNFKLLYSIIKFQPIKTETEVAYTFGYSP